MQKSWREDEDKLTFILLSADMIEEGKSELESMIGEYALKVKNTNYALKFDQSQKPF